MTLKEKRFQPLLTVKSPETLDTSKRTFEAVISSDSVDRDGEIVEPKAFEKRLGSFMKNPLLLWMHNAFAPPIGKVPEVRIGDKSIEALIQFREEGKSDVADEIFSAYADGTLNSFSIGFCVFAMADPEPDGEDGKMTPPRILDAELFEVSAVTIPANTDAVSKMVKRAQLLSEGIEEIQKMTGKPSNKVMTIKSSEPYSAVTSLQVLEAAPQMVEDVVNRHLSGESISEQERQAVEDLRMACLGVKSFGSKDDPAAESELVGALEDFQGFLDGRLN